ncbi:LysR substrate-binding domain-containing protein [Brevibacillus humidisoli]|nr:LysR substrate-binding domain-containing protein [Brevibacillus humidisoli]
MTCEAHDTGTILAMVQEWIGVSVLPKRSIPAERQGIRAVPLQPRVFRKVGLGVRSVQSLSPLAAEFIVYAQKQLPAA